MTELVILKDGKVTTTSRKVAEIFHKRHDNVMRDIKQILLDGDEFTHLIFEVSTYNDSTGRTLPEYSLTKDAFSLIAMGFSGKKALMFKQQYIKAFNHMESIINNSVIPRTEDQILLDAMNILTLRVSSLQMKLVNTEQDLVFANHTITLQAPKVKYNDEVLQAPNGHPITLIAKDLGMSAIRLNKELEKMGIQYKVSGTWVLKAPYQNLNYTVSHTHLYTDDHGVRRSKISTEWTELGRQFIFSLFPNISPQGQLQLAA